MREDEPGRGDLRIPYLLFIIPTFLHFLPRPRYRPWSTPTSDGCGFGLEAEYRSRETVAASKVKKNDKNFQGSVAGGGHSATVSAAELTDATGDEKNGRKTREMDRREAKRRVRGEQKGREGRKTRVDCR